MIGYVYKLYCDGVDGFYIGSSFDMKDRKRCHKSNCNNPKSKDYDLKVYQYIRANGGFDNWKFEILETAIFENKNALRIREQHYKNLLIPSLNDRDAYITEEEKQEKQRNYNKNHFLQKINCACGGKTDKSNKARHEKSPKHQKYLQTINNITNITYNITNLTINK